MDNITTASPVEIDSELDRLQGELYTAQDAANRAENNIHAAAEPKRRWISRTRQAPFTLTFNEAVDKLTAEGHRNIESLLATFHAARRQLVAVLDAIGPLNAEFTRRGRWERAYLVVTNGKGHVHTSTACPTWRRTTQYRWITELSGQDRDAIINAIREDACTVCYPGAPVGPRTVFTAEERAARDAAKAERDAKAAKKALTGITHPDGTDLRGEYGVLKTERAAQMAYVDFLFNAEWYQPGSKLDAKDAEAAAYILVALAHKRGVEIPALIAELDEKVADKLKRERAAAAKHAKKLGFA